MQLKFTASSVNRNSLNGLVLSRKPSGFPASSVNRNNVKRHLVLAYIASSLTLSLLSWTQLPREVSSVAHWALPFRTNPAAAGLVYALSLVVLSASYLGIINLVRNNHLSDLSLWGLVTIGSVIFLFGYPAFSKDIFNYAFWAKTVTVYHQNPYQTPPAAFVDDPWLNLLNWKEVGSSHGPIWILLTLLPSLIGGSSLFLTVFLIKILIATAHFLLVSVLARLTAKTTTASPAFCLSLYALNPLILIETLLNGHNDAVMIFLLLASLLSLSSGHLLGSAWLWLLSILTKIVTIALFPVYLLITITKISNQKLVWEKIYRLSLFLLLIVFLLSPLRRSGSISLGAHPWYFVWIFPLIILSGHWLFVKAAVYASFFLALNYLPDLLNQPKLSIWLTLFFRETGIVGVALLTLFSYSRLRRPARLAESSGSFTAPSDCLYDSQLAPDRESH